MDHAPPPEPITELPLHPDAHPDVRTDAHPDAGARPEPGTDVPYRLDVLPDGRETLVAGDVDRFADFTHPQGDNPFGYRGTCGLCSCEGVLRQFGVDVGEAEVVAHAIARGLCETDGDPAMRGGTSLTDQARVLGDFGVPAHTERADSLEDLAAALEHGRGVIVAANAGVLWDDADSYDGGRANHAVVPIGVARDPATGGIQGFYINDSGTGEQARFVDAATMAEAWLDAGGGCVVTDRVHAAPHERTTQ
ncbi:hypothetical protein ACFCX4_33280 [Kitasatospora sp. NPDC056327]|uniref:hypothetical protein n=1 Tax=Kitasatospora sp. NPDC056327 TaxID=3345785 RepID=UPI0035E011D8